MKKLLFFVLVCGVMSACDNTNRYDLPKEKIPLLKNNDIFYFQDSASHKIDTLCLNIRDYWSQTLEQNYFRYIIVQYVKPNKKSIFLQTNITSHAEGYASFSLLFSESDFNTSIKSISYKVNGVTYPSVYIVNDNVVLQSDTIPKTVYFTYPNGIIRYEYKDGRVYNLLSK